MSGARRSICTFLYLRLRCTLVRELRHLRLAGGRGLGREPLRVADHADRGAGDQEDPHDRALRGPHGAQDRDVRLVAARDREVLQAVTSEVRGDDVDRAAANRHPDLRLVDEWLRSSWHEAYVATGIIANRDVLVTVSVEVADLNPEGIATRDRRRRNRQQLEAVVAGGRVVAEDPDAPLDRDDEVDVDGEPLARDGKR